MFISNNPDAKTYTRLGILLVGTGILLAIDSFLELSVVHKLWPLVIASLGIGLVGIFVKTRARGEAYLGIGIYLICFSGLALFCNFTSWDHINTLWPMFVVFLGIVVFSLFMVNRDRNILLLAALLLFSLGIIFLVVFVIDASFWWIIFILTGISFLVSVHVS